VAESIDAGEAVGHFRGRHGGNGRAARGKGNTPGEEGHVRCRTSSIGEGRLIPKWHQDAASIPAITPPPRRERSRTLVSLTVPRSQHTGAPPRPPVGRARRDMISACLLDTLPTDDTNQAIATSCGRAGRERMLTPGLGGEGLVW
jgi:hypothetical protein